MPVFLKKDLEDQIPSLKKLNLKFIDFARKSIQDLIQPEILKKAQVKQFNYSSSCIAVNEGNGKFTIKRMPDNVQFSSVNAIQPVDINYDGHPDLVLGGNMFGFVPQFARLDASFGNVLINDGKGNFISAPARQTGLELRGETKDIKSLKINSKEYLLILQNNEYPVLYNITTVGKK
jgi:hypothetical protein